VVIPVPEVVILDATSLTKVHVAGNPLKTTLPVGVTQSIE
jgi:hypothetical protein